MPRSLRALLEATQGEEAWGGVEMETDLGLGSSSMDTCTQEEIRACKQERKPHRGGGQAQGTLRQGLRIERAEARGRGACLGVREGPVKDTHLLWGRN